METLGAPALAFAAACLALLAAAQALEGAVPQLPGLTRRLARALEATLRVGREGREPGALERRRLLLAGALAALAAGAFLAGPIGGLVAAAAAPWGVSRALALRRERHRAAVDEGAGAVALALADALRGGHSLRGAIGESASAVPGPAGRELHRLAAELAAGARTDEALEALGRRVRSPRIDVLVAACLLQRRAGGDLARLLRECAGAFADQARVEGEARAATAQARFTGLVVVLLPVAGAALAELTSPGFVAGLAGSFLTAWLVGIALALQVVAAVAIRRLGRVRA